MHVVGVLHTGEKRKRKRKKMVGWDRIAFYVRCLRTFSGIFTSFHGLRSLFAHIFGDLYFISRSG